MLIYVMSDKPDPSELSHIRQRLGWSMDDVAKLLHTTRQTIHRWENSKTPIDLARWELLIFKLNLIENTPLKIVKK